jgi:ubiquinone/menaquinone biosynthesis C-methylase UbiE
MADDSMKWKTEFDTEARARVYDQFIDLFSLRRVERMKVLQAILPVPSRFDLNILELGTGTGLLTERLVQRYSGASIVTVEGAEKMMAQAKTKMLLQENNGRIRWVLADYSSPSWLDEVSAPFDLVVALDSLHHLVHQRVGRLYREIFNLTAPGGSMFISDHITSQASFFDEPQFKLWIDELCQKFQTVEEGSDIAAILESIFSLPLEEIHGLSIAVVQDVFTAMLKKEGENPLPIMQHIDMIREAGFDRVIIEYRFGNFAIFSAKKE